MSVNQALEMVTVEALDSNKLGDVYPMDTRRFPGEPCLEFPHQLV